MLNLYIFIYRHKKIRNFFCPSLKTVIIRVFKFSVNSALKVKLKQLYNKRQSLQSFHIYRNISCMKQL